MSPFGSTVLAVVDRFGTTPNRCNILHDWLSHRRELRDAGIIKGFQWLDGSFVEDKEPNDLDLVTFLHRPAGCEDLSNWIAWLEEHKTRLVRDDVKRKYRLDFFAIDLYGDPETTVDVSSYFLGLFSHKRSTNQWKGMVKVRLEEDDSEAAKLLSARIAAFEDNS